MRVTECVQNSVSPARSTTLRFPPALVCVPRVAGSADSVADFPEHFIQSLGPDGETAALTLGRILSLLSE